MSCPATIQNRTWLKAPILAGLFVCLSSIFVLYTFDPATSGRFPPCPFLVLTGYYCPGCGTLRALHQLLKGNFAQAFAMNPLILVCLPFLLSPGGSWVAQCLSRRPPARILPAIYIRLLAVAVVLFGVLRNLPMYPFALLAPGGLLR
jgi:hypothetical protein